MAREDAGLRTILSSDRTRAYDSSDPYFDYIFFDNFTDDDGVLLTSHEPNKGWPWWSVSSGDPAGLVINTNQFWINLHSTTEWSLVLVDAGTADCVICARIIFAGGSRNSGICFRAVDNENMMVANPSLSAGLLRLYKVENNGWNLLDSEAHAYTNGDEVDLRVTASGNDLLVEDLTFDHSVSATNAFNNTIANHGIGENWGFNSFRIDNFNIE